VIDPTCEKCRAKIPHYFEGQRSCPCEAKPPQKTAVELVAEFTAGVEQIKGVFAAYAAEIARLRGLLVRAETALAFSDADTDVYAEAVVLDHRG
jgi:hypothetical protein